ncbi:MAG TPA: hypothetical protein ENH85_12665 [Candidatus Scalindua sp.]|nr:hypothetical protein [Candidatus Scalindua sp.]
MTIKKFAVLLLIMMALSLGFTPSTLAIRPFQIADDAEVEEAGLWEFEFGFVVERLKTDEPKKTVIDFPGEIDIDYGLPWNAEIGFDFRAQALDVDGEDTLVEPVSEFAIFYKQEFKTWEFEKLDIQIGGELGIDVPTTRERRKTGKFNIPGFFALSLWEIYDKFDLHFLIEGEGEEIGGKNDIKLSFGTFIEYPLRSYKDFHLVAEYGNEKVEKEKRRHVLLGGFKWANPSNIIKEIGGHEISFDAAPFFWFTEGRSSVDWGVTAGFEWVW